MSDSGLKAVVDAWPQLPEKARSEILMVIARAIAAQLPATVGRRPDELLSITEALAFLPDKVYRGTLRVWMVDGHNGIRLESRRIGGRWFTTRAWIETFVEAQQAVPEVKPRRSQQADRPKQPTPPKTDWKKLICD